MTLELTGALVGLVYLWLEYKASIYLWIASIVMPAVYLFVFYEAGLYADFGINLYYIGAAIYGWWAWRHGNGTERNGERNGERPITHLPRREWLKAAIMYGVAQGTIGWILADCTDSDVPWWDAFTTALSVVGMWMLARKYIEQWGVWMVVDIGCVGLYLYKDLPFTAALYALYALIAVFGYRKWKKLMS